MKSRERVCLFRQTPKKRTLTRDISERREDSKRMEGWVSGRGNKRGSKSRPGPGVVNERAPAGCSRGFERVVTSLGASHRHPFHPRSMTRPCVSRSIPRPFLSGSFSLVLVARHPFELNRVVVPVLKGAAAVSATWQPRLYLAPFHTISHSRHFVAHLFLSPIYHPFYIHAWSWCLSLSLSIPHSLAVSLFLCLACVSCHSFLLGDINNAIAQASNFRTDGSNNVWSASSTKELRASCHCDHPAVNMMFESPFRYVRWKSR